MPSALRSVFAVVFGYIAMIVIVIPLTLIAVKFFAVRSGQPTPGYLVYNVAATLLAAFLGGFICARIAVARPVTHGLVLGLLAMLLAAVSYLQYKGMQPLWYQIMLVILPACAIVAGSALAARSVPRRP